MDTTNKNFGRRVELVHTDDKFTSLKPGDKGIYQNKEVINFPGVFEVQHWIEWDNKSRLMLINSKDEFKFIN